MPTITLAVAVATTSHLYLFLTPSLLPSRRGRVATAHGRLNQRDGDT
jgi:hypothetical protein